MGTIHRLLLIVSVVALSSCAVVRTASLQAPYDKRFERLQRERDKLNRTTDPVDRAKTDINISEILLSLLLRIENRRTEVLEKRLKEYVETIQDARKP
jgi:hypothetical protein